MSKFYYKKYNIGYSYTYSNQRDASYGYIIRNWNSKWVMYTGYNWSSSRGFYGTGQSITCGFRYNSSPHGWYVITPTAVAQDNYESHGEDEWFDKKKICDSTAIERSGTFVADIIAEEGTYPANGKHSDGYWYIKGKQVAPNVYAKVNGVWKSTNTMYIVVSGLQKEVDGLWVNLNGVWRKS